MGEPLLYAVYGVWEESMFNIFDNTFSLFQLVTKNTFYPLKLFAYPTVLHWAFKSVTKNSQAPKSQK